MESSLNSLLPLFEREHAAHRAVALGVLVRTIGSTYRKAGALMLIASNGDYAGLLSGGCLETDLREHALEVIRSGEPRLVDYDTRGGDDLIWGLGLGCEGAISILLLRVGPEQSWQPLSHLVKSLAQRQRTAVGVMVESERPDLPVGAVVLPGSTPEGAMQSALESAAAGARPGWFESTAPRCRMFALPLTLPPQLLLLGAGPDAAPVVELAGRLGWRVTLVDHRPAYADASHFPAAERVIQAHPEELPSRLELSAFSATVVMSHHLPSDLAYLRVLSRSAIPYVGLLGPVARRERLLSELESDATGLRGRLRSPVGLAIGGRTPEAVALSIVAEIHAFLHGAEGGTPTTRDQPVVGGQARPVPA